MTNSRQISNTQGISETANKRALYQSIAIPSLYNVWLVINLFRDGLSFPGFFYPFCAFISLAFVYLGIYAYPNIESHFDKFDTVLFN